MVSADSPEVQPLIDADVLVYQVGFGVQYKDEEGEVVIPSFDRCIELLDQIVGEIEEEVWATREPIFYLTASRSLVDSLNKTGKKLGHEPMEYVPNFRDQVAVTKPYKGTRVASKPYHYDNLMTYIANTKDCKIATGFEADDLMAVDHYAKEDGVQTVLCSRDKDLKMIPGSFYSWPCYKTPGERLEIDEVGFLQEPKKGKLNGGGLKFFYAQLIMGDTVDNIPGLMRGGPVMAYEALEEAETEEEMWTAVTELYQSKCGEDIDWRGYLLEQANLLWIRREINEQGQLVPYVPYDERE